MQRWWVCFSDKTDLDFWWRPLLKPGFRHCYAITWMANDVALIVNPLATLLEHITDTGPLSPYIRRALDMGERVLVIDRPDAPYDQRPFSPHVNGALLTCASVIAYSVRCSRRVWTPYQLYRQLLREGARELTDG